MATYISHSPAETEAVGESWARRLQEGAVLGLSGELGAGKTQLVKGIARGLGSPQRVHSPTFSLINVYSGGRLTLFHLDLFRLETPKQIMGTGLEEYLAPSGVTVIEWPERWFGYRGLADHDMTPGGTNRSPADSNQRHEPQERLDKARSLLTPSVPAKIRWVKIEILSETERRISYENIGTRVLFS